MGLIGWIKKEIESTSRQRRQSAPAPIAISPTSPNQNRDEAYMRAISKFTEWRNNNRFERLDETKNVSGFSQPAMSDTILSQDFSIISDVVIDDGERRRLLQMHRDRKQQEKIRRHEHKAVLNCESSRNHRLSLPIMKGNPERPTRRKSRKSQIHPSNTIDEVEEFEQKHCHHMDEDYSNHVDVTSPPRLFYRSNVEPYGQENSRTPEPKKPTPRNKSLMGRNMLRRSKGAAKGKAPQPPGPPQIVESESSNFYNGNFKHYDVNSTSVYEEFLGASNAYRVSMRKHQPEKVNSVGESASSGSLSSDPEKNAKKLRRLSPPYQTVINKHGDEVEYALPYSERESMSNIPPLPETSPPKMLAQSQFEQIINENFQFLNADLQFFQTEELSMNRQLGPLVETVDASFSDIRRKDLQVTDLDKSNDTGLVTPAQSGNFFAELDALSKWTNTLKDCDRNFDAKSPIDEYRAIQNNVKVFASKDIKYKSGILRNSFSTPLEFSNGYFHTTPVTLRSTLPNLYSINSFADVASKHEFEILSQINHQAVAILMGVCHDEDLRVMTLVMEPFEYTLNHYLHQMDQYFPIQQTIAIVKLVASAAQYLHECGLVHSNISSHAVLIREEPFAVKLSSFELTTEILPRESFSKIFHPLVMSEGDNNLTMTTPAEAGLSEKYYKLSKQHFFNRTSLPSFRNAQDGDDIDSRLPYSVAFRRMFSMHYYQPPELLIPSYDANFKYVLPTTRSDTFALALLLWESLNHCVPFVIFNHDELILAFKKNDAKLPFLDKTATAFMEIFDVCLRANPADRLSDVSEFISMLEEIQHAGDGKRKDGRIQEIPQPVYNHMTLESQKNFKNAKLNEKLPEKVYFTRTDGGDPQRRGENAITSENLAKLGRRDSLKISESLKSSELEAHIASFSNQPGILLNDEALERIRRTVEDQRVIAPKKPNRRMDENCEMNHTKRSMADSTMYQSFFDFNKLHTPKIDKDVIYERTSTLKKRLKAPENRDQKRSVKGLFDQAEPVEDEIQNVFDKMNSELSQIVQDYNRNDFMNEIAQEANERHERGEDNAGLSSFLNCAMTTRHHDQSRSFDDIPSGKERNDSQLKRSDSDYVQNTSAYRFSVGDYALPKTPIARQNKIRRNAWLSDSKKPSGGRISDFGLKPNKSGGDINPNNSSEVGPPNLNRKQYNVSIKFHQNDLDSVVKHKSSNASRNDSSINIQLKSPVNNRNASPLIKVNNCDLNSSKYNADINKKYYPMMPEMLCDVIQNKRDKSGFLHVSHCENEVILRQHEKEDSGDVVVPVRTSVRDAVKFIESSFNPKESQVVASPVRSRPSSQTFYDKFSTPSEDTDKTVEEFQNEVFLPSTELAKVEEDGVSECLMKASESIQRLDDIFQSQPQSMPLIVSKRLESISNTPKKITTKVTVNLKKISRRSSDVEHLKQAQEQSRHSICNNAELIKRIQMHFKSKDSSLQIKRKNNSMSASCSSLAPRDKKSELGRSQPGKCSSCRTCGVSMMPPDMLHSFQSQGRISISSSLAEGLQSMRHDDKTQSMATLRKYLSINDTKSTEDLYIDDDFCQGISQSLAANMELLPTPDFLESIDFNFLTTEIFHTHEHDFTLTDGERMQLDWHASDNENDDVFECVADHDEEPEKITDVTDHPMIECKTDNEVTSTENATEESKPEEN